MRSVITVVGKDRTGIIAMISAMLYKYNGNILDIAQNVLGGIFTMMMLVDISELNIPFDRFVVEMENLGATEKVKIHVMHEDIFNAMHRI
ncbi:MAG: ACT domain-containing protein [Bacillota bacterium]|nr:ACT domain-containing protein [Bacillota bacterium]